MSLLLLCLPTGTKILRHRTILLHGRPGMEGGRGTSVERSVYSNMMQLHVKGNQACCLCQGLQFTTGVLFVSFDVCVGIGMFLAGPPSHMSNHCLFFGSSTSDCFVIPVLPHHHVFRSAFETCSRHSRRRTGGP